MHDEVALAQDIERADTRSGKLKLPDGPAVCVLSGGNADLAAILG